MHAKSWFRLNGPDGLLTPTAWSVKWAFNEGWSWSASVPVSQLLPNFAANAVFSAVISDGRGALRYTPILVAVGPRVLAWGTQGLEVRIQGTDRTTQRLAKKGQNFDTFRNTTASQIVTAIEQRAEVTVQGRPDFPIFEEEIKQSSFGEPLKRLATVDASQLLIDDSGVMHFVPYGWTASDWTFAADGGTWEYDPSRKVTEITFVKQSSMEQPERDLAWDSSGYKTQALPQPLSHIVPTDRSTVGAVVTIGFWDGDPTGGGALISYWPMGVEDGAFLNVDQSGQWPATHITCSVMEPQPPFDTLPVAARLKLSGSSPETIPAGIDLAFEHTYSSGETGVNARPADSVISEPLYPSKAHVIEVAPRVLWDINKDTSKVSCSGPQDCQGQLGDVLQPLPIFDQDGTIVGYTPEAQVYEIEDSWGGGQGTDPVTSIVAYALP